MSFIVKDIIRPKVFSFARMAMHITRKQFMKSIERDDCPQNIKMLSVVYCVVQVDQDQKVDTTSKCGDVMLFPNPSNNGDREPCFCSRHQRKDGTFFRKTKIGFNQEKIFYPTAEEAKIVHKGISKKIGGEWRIVKAIDLLLYVNVGI